jgi:hypothetical protein
VRGNRTRDRVFLLFETEDEILDERVEVRA